MNSVSQFAHRENGPFLPLLRSTRILVPALAVLCLCGCHTQTQPSARATTQPKSKWLKTWQSANPVWRGVHLMAHTDDQLGKLIEQLPNYAAVGVNVIILEVNYSYQFQSHPELCAAPGISKARAKEVTAAAHAHGIRLIPQFNCLGHQSWSKNTLPLLVKYPQFDETPGQYPENKGIYCRSWCPQNPDVNPVVFALIDELIEAFEADAFHVGMDEVFLIASEHCPRCKGGDPAKLFAKAINDLHAHLAGKRKVEMLLWGDRLLPAQTLGYSEWEASKNHTEAAVDLVPKDLIICDWHYEKRAEYPSVPWLADKGFRVWPSGWQPLEANLAFSKYSRELHNPKVIGYLCTTWGKVTLANAPEWPPIKEVLPAWKTPK